MGMQYNNTAYNHLEYDQGQLLLQLSDVQSSSDAKTAADLALKTEAISLALQLANYIQVAATSPVSTYLNPDFETGWTTTFWTNPESIVVCTPWFFFNSHPDAGENYVLSRDTVNVKKGKYSVKLDVTSIGNPNVSFLRLFQSFSAVNYRSKTVTLGCWVKTTSPGIRIAIHGGSDTQLSPFHPGDGTWRFLQTTLTFSPTEATVAVYLMGYADHASVGTTYFDATGLSESTQGLEEMFLSDSRSLQLLLAKIETLSSTDAFASALFRPFLDTLSLSDTHAMKPQLTETDSLGVTDVVTVGDTMAKMEVMSISDLLRPFLVAKGITETTSLAEILTFILSMSLADFQFLIDQLTKQITEKKLGDSIRFNTWLEIRKQAANIWTSLP